MHLGWFAFNAAVRGFEVYGWEPGNYILDKARFNRCLNGPDVEKNVHIFEHGLGANDTTCHIYLTQ
jgi:hypothetical protein